MIDETTGEHMHECDYYCIDPACVLRQRNELRDSLERRVWDAYRRGWNTSLSTAAIGFEQEFKRSFGADTVSSFSIWLRSQRKCD